MLSVPKHPASFVHDSCVFLRWTTWFTLAKLTQRMITAGDCSTWSRSLPMWRPRSPQSDPTSCLFCLCAVGDLHHCVFDCFAFSLTFCSTGVSRHMSRRMMLRVGRCTLGFSCQPMKRIHRAVCAPLCVSVLWTVSVCEKMQRRILKDNGLSFWLR